MLGNPIRQVGMRVNYSDLEAIEANLLLKARETTNNSFPPASKFCVGAAVWIPSAKKIVAGTNYECSSFGLTMCGDRTAIFAANTLGYSDISHMAIVTRMLDGTPTKEASAPCGACRQIIYDAARRSGNDIEIITASTNFDHIIKTSIYELLPMPFSFDDFGVDLKAFQKK